MEVGWVAVDMLVLAPVKSVRAAFDAGADGVVLAREYVEMWLANLSAAGEALREIFAKRG